MLRADAAWREALRATTVADLLVGVIAEAPPAGLAKAVEWIESVTNPTPATERSG
jgi:hypothetical protein